MFQNPIDLFYGWSDQASSFDRLVGILRDRNIPTGDLLRDWITQYKIHPTNRSLYLDFSLLEKRTAKLGFTKLTIRIHAEPRIDELDPKEDEWSYEKKLKERRLGYSGQRELTLTQEEVLTEFIPNQILLMEVVLKREIAHIVLVRN